MSANAPVALLEATSITVGWTGLLATSRGGTGVDIATTALTLGTASVANGELILHSSANAFTTTIRTGVTGASYTLVLPTTDGGAGEFLQTDGSGNLSWSASGGGGALSAITAATGINTIDSLNFAQTWNWSTLNTQTAFSHNFNALTTGTAYEFLTSSATLNSTNGVFRVINSGASTTGILARFQSNSTAGSGMTILGTGLVGIGTTSPSYGLHVSSSGAERIRLTGQSANIDLYAQTTNTGIVFNSGLILRQSGATSDVLELIGAQVNALTRLQLRGGTVGNILIDLSCGQAGNTSIISMFRGTTETIRLVDNNSNDSYFNTSRGVIFGGTSRTSTTALVEISSTSAGFVKPRMTGAQWAAIASKTQGLEAFDTTVKSNVYVDATGGITHYIPSYIFSQTNDVTVANTVTETTILGTGTGTKTLDANDLTVGKTIHVKVRGIISDTGTPTVRIRVKLGATTIGDTGAIALAGTITNEEFDVDYMFTCRTVGATGTVIGSGYFHYDNAASAGTSFGMPATGTTTIDTTASLALDVTIEWGAADPANTITSQVSNIKFST